MVYFPLGILKQTDINSPMTASEIDASTVPALAVDVEKPSLSDKQGPGMSWASLAQKAAVTDNSQAAASPAAETFSAPEPASTYWST